MSVDNLIFILSIAIQSSVAVLFATLGEVFTERSGVLNLGVEGMMLMGALSGFAATFYSHSLLLGVLASLAVGGLLAMVHGFFTITLRANQVVCGLALTILGIGLSSFLGRPIIGRVAERFVPIPIPVLKEIPILGPVLFNQSALIYVGYVLVPLSWFFLYHTRPGLNLRSIGENPAAADTAGIGVIPLRYLWTAFGGMLAGLGGAYLSLCYTPGWKENMTSGQGWIAIAMVIFALWNPFRAVLGALLFGGVNALQFYFEARQIDLIPSYILRMLPYLFTIAILVIITRRKTVRKRVGAPASLGLPFQREETF
jgi:general nucleoside transport system permease protein